MQKECFTPETRMSKRSEQVKVPVGAGRVCMHISKGLRPQGVVISSQLSSPQADDEAEGGTGSQADCATLARSKV